MQKLWDIWESKLDKLDVEPIIHKAEHFNVLPLTKVEEHDKFYKLVLEKIKNNIWWFSKKTLIAQVEKLPTWESPFTWGYRKNFDSLGDLWYEEELLKLGIVVIKNYGQINSETDIFKVLQNECLVLESARKRIPNFELKKVFVLEKEEEYKDTISQETGPLDFITLSFYIQEYPLSKEYLDSINAPKKTWISSRISNYLSNLFS